MLDSKDFLFVVGSPRSGTTMLQILLANHPQVASTVEQTLYQHYVSPWLEIWETEVHNLEERGWKLGLPILWAQSELEAFLREFLNRAYAKILAIKPEATHILDKHPGYSLHIGTIKRFIPRARFIHIIRDGRDVAASMLAVNAKMGFAPAQVPAAAEKWRKFVLAARDAAEPASNYIEVRYEEFLSGKTDAYSRVLEFCGLPSTTTWISEMIAANSFEKMKERGAAPDPRLTLSQKRYHRGTAGGWEQDFSPWDRFEFDRVAGDLLLELGYARAGWWAESELERVLLPLRHAVEKRRPFLKLARESARSAIFGPPEPTAPGR